MYRTNIHKLRYVSHLLCFIGRHDFEFSRITSDGALLTCFYCGHQRLCLHPASEAPQAAVVLRTTMGVLHDELCGLPWAGPALPSNEDRLGYILGRLNNVLVFLDKLVAPRD